MMDFSPPTEHLPTLSDIQKPLFILNSIFSSICMFKYYLFFYCFVLGVILICIFYLETLCTLTVCLMVGVGVFPKAQGKHAIMQCSTVLGKQPQKPLRPALFLCLLLRFCRMSRFLHPNRDATEAFHNQFRHKELH